VQDIKKLVQTGTDGNDELHAYGDEDTVLNGGLGNDLLYGADGKVMTSFMLTVMKTPYLMVVLVMIYYMVQAVMIH